MEGVEGDKGVLRRFRDVPRIHAGFPYVASRFLA